MEITCSIVESIALTYSISPYSGGSLNLPVSVDGASSSLIVNKAQTSAQQNFVFWTNVFFGTESFSKQIDLTFDVSVDCQVDKCETCINGEPTKWEICEDGYSLFQDEWISGAIAAAVTAVKVAMAIGTLTSIMSPQGAYSMVNQFQIFMLMPLTEAFFPVEVIMFLTGLDFTMLSFSFLPLDEISGVDIILSWFDFKQEDNYYSEMGLASGSTIVNTYTLFITFALIAVLHVILYFFYRKVKNVDIKKFIHKVIMKVFDWMTFNIYIRMFIEAYLLIILSSIKEPFNFSDNQKGTKVISLLANIVLSLTWISFFGICVYQWIKSIDERTFENQYYFNEFYEGVKNSWTARVYSSLFLAKRLTLCFIVIVLSVLPMLVKIILFMVVESIWCISICLIKPFNELKLNIIEIVNELFFTCACIGMFFLNQENDWSDTMTLVYVYFLVANMSLISLISVGKPNFKPILFY